MRDVGDLGVAFSPDSQTVATVCRFNEVRLWAADMGALRLHFLVRHGGVSDLLFTPDGKRVLAGSHGRVRCWDAKSGKLIHWPGALGQAKVERLDDDDDDDNVTSAISPDARLLATVGNRLVRQGNLRVEFRQLQLWELRTGKLRWTIPDESGLKRLLERRQRHDSASTRRTRSERSVAFSPDGKTLVWNQGESIELVDVVRGLPLRQLGPRPDNVAALAFSPAGGLLAIACHDGTVRLLDPATGTICSMLNVPGGSLYCIAFSPDGRTLATGGTDTTILIWDVNRILEAWRPRLGQPSTAELETLWQSLASEKGTEAAKAMARLQAIPKEAIALLRQRLRPVVRLDAGKVGQLLDDLGSDDFGIRKRADQELAQLGDRAEPFLRKRLKQSPSLEVRRRLEALLEALDDFTRLPGSTRADRALEVLEHLNTPPAQALLRELAGGAPEARLTREAKASLQRLARRSATP
jgi:WD40 repeat protein